jgi:solute carrier family 39 (zinc transporter), member 1/2/3
MDYILELKVIFIFLMFFSAGVAGSIPIFSKSFKNNDTLISIGNCFAGGIFLLVGIAHLLPDAQDAFDEVTGDTTPIGYVLSIAGYTLILYVENLLFKVHGHHPEESSPNIQEFNSVQNNIPREGVARPLKDDFSKENPEHECGNQNCPATSPAVIYADYMPAFILTAALVVHSIFEGIAAGLLDSQSSVISICVAILVHNIPAAIALGIKMKGIKTWISVLLMLCFVISSPLGLAIGISLSSLDYPILRGIFLSISSGTFVYIGATEIMAEEYEKNDHKYSKFFGFLLGWIPIGLVTILVGG